MSQRLAVAFSDPPGLAIGGTFLGQPVLFAAPDLPFIIVAAADGASFRGQALADPRVVQVEEAPWVPPRTGPGGAGPEVLPGTSFLNVWAGVALSPLCFPPPINVCTPVNVVATAVWGVEACSGTVAVLQWAGGAASGRATAETAVLNGPPEVPGSVGPCYLRWYYAPFILANCAVAEGTLAPVAEVPLADAGYGCGVV